MLANIALFTIFLITVLFVTLLFLQDIIAVILNGVVLYLIGLKAHADITKRHKTKEYLIAALIALILTTLVGHLFPLWKLTTFIILAFVVAQLIMMKK